MPIQDYIIDHQGFDWAKLLENWHWLLREQFVIWIMNRFGDLFVVVENGTVHMLDVGAGSLSQIAESRTAFEVEIDDSANAANWLLVPLIDRLVAAGMTLSEGECYGFRLPPVLGGRYEIENVATTSIQDYLAACGSIHGQMTDVPDGGQVILKVTNRDEARRTGG